LKTQAVSYYSILLSLQPLITINCFNVSLVFIFLRQGNYEQAIENLKQFLRVTEQNGDRDSRREACSDIGVVYNFMVSLRIKFKTR